MASQETKTNERQQSQGQDLGRNTQQQPQRRGGSSRGFGLIPSDFFRLTPFSLMRRMSEEMNRMFGDLEPGWGGGEERTWAPVIEVSQRDNNFMVRADLPGIKPEDVKLEINDDAIVLAGERKSEHEETKGGVHVSERRYGRFYRTVPLPEGAKTDQARARFDNGVLEITIPSEQRKAQRREIPIEGSAAAKAKPSEKAA